MLKGAGPAHGLAQLSTRMTNRALIVKFATARVLQQESLDTVRMDHVFAR